MPLPPTQEGGFISSLSASPRRPSHSPRVAPTPLCQARLGTLAVPEDSCREEPAPLSFPCLLPRPSPFPQPRQPRLGAGQCRVLPAPPGSCFGEDPQIPVGRVLPDDKHLSPLPSTRRRTRSCGQQSLWPLGGGGDGPSTWVMLANRAGWMEKPRH